MKCSSYHVTVCCTSLTIFYNCRVFLSTVELSAIKITVVCFNYRVNMKDAHDSDLQRYTHQISYDISYSSFQAC